MTIYCENALIKNNSIVDQSDIAIVIMGIDVVGVDQQSTITGNVIVSAGNSMNAPIHSDVLTAISLTGPASTNPATLGDETPGTGQKYPCYAGTTFTNNTFWTGPNTAFDFAMGAGGRPYFATARLFDGQCTGTFAGQGATYTNNGTGILAATVKEAIAISGIYGVTITNDGTNPLNYNVNANFFPKGLPSRACPATAVVIEANHSTGATVYLPSTSTANIDQVYVCEQWDLDLHVVRMGVQNHRNLFVGELLESLYFESDCGRRAGWVAVWF